MFEEDEGCRERDGLERWFVEGTWQSVAEERLVEKMTRLHDGCREEDVLKSWFIEKNRERQWRDGPPKRVDRTKFMIVSCEDWCSSH